MPARLVAIVANIARGRSPSSLSRRHDQAAAARQRADPGRGRRRRRRQRSLRLGCSGDGDIRCNRSTSSLRRFYSLRTQSALTPASLPALTRLTSTTGPAEGAPGHCGIPLREHAGPSTRGSLAPKKPAALPVLAFILLGLAARRAARPRTLARRRSPCSLFRCGRHQADPSLPPGHVALAVGDGREAHQGESHRGARPSREFKRRVPKPCGSTARSVRAPGPCTSRTQSGVAVHPPLRGRVEQRDGQRVLRRAADGHRLPAALRTAPASARRAPRTTGRPSSRCGSPSTRTAPAAASTRGPIRRVPAG